MKRRVVITGMGAITPLGNTAEDTWAAALRGECGIGPITRYDAGAQKVRLAAEVKNWSAADALGAQESRRLARFTQLALAAAREAVEASGLDLAAVDRTRAGVSVSSGIGGVEETENQQTRCLARGAKIIAEVAGYGVTCDAHHITSPAPQGEGGARAMAQALDDAGAAPDQVDYINAHGTSTSLNDSCETAAIKAVFGSHAYGVAVSSTKSMTGHLLGAAGAVEAVLCAQVLRDGVVPPTINYREADPACDLDYVTEGARRLPVRYALSNSLGFGGHNACLLFKKWEG